MATTTPKLSLLKPVPNVETDWGFRLNETIDLLDDSLFTDNLSGIDGIEVFDSGTSLVTVSGFRGETIAISGSLQSFIDTNAVNIAANSAQIVSVSGHLQNQFDPIVANTGNFSQSLTVSGVPVATSFFHQQIIQAVNETASGTPGGTFTAGAWRTRDLNELVLDETGEASLASSVLTIPSGTYYATGHAIALNVNIHQARVRDVTNGITLVSGTTHDSFFNSNSSNASLVDGLFTVLASTDIELQHRCTATFATRGFGFESGFEDTRNRFAILTLRRIL